MLSRSHTLSRVPWLQGLLTLAFLATATGAQRRAPAPHQRHSGVPFEIVSCSLGCMPGPSGEIGCGTTDIAVNTEIRVTFSLPVARASLNASTFQLVEIGTGRFPPSVLTLDPADPSTVVFRPQMSFDSGGNPLFGLIPDRSYLLRIPGTLLDPLGPYLTSVDGQPNRTRLQCVLETTLGVEDPHPGRPRVKLQVLAVLERDPETGLPTLIGRVPAQGAVDVLRESPIFFTFDDLMNPATVANPVTGQSSFLRVFLDPDGDPSTLGDQLPIAGRFVLTIDQEHARTQVLFEATGGLPPSGTGRRPALISVDVSPLASDLGGNALLNPGRTVFATESF